MENNDGRIMMTPLGKTWLLDIDGTLVKHNGYKLDGEDTLLKGIENLLAQILPEDTVVLLTSRQEEYKEVTEAFLQARGIRYDHIIFGLPYGERILINDRKPSGCEMSVAVNTDRDAACRIKFIRDSEM